MKLQNQFPIPVYLNQSYVFDVLAMMEDGFSHVKSLKETQSEQHEKNSTVSGELGVSNAFALLGVKFGGGKELKAGNETSHESTEEKVHTPNSLFFKMRVRLHELEVIASDLSEVKPGDFVEFSVTLRKNPMIHALENIQTMFRMAGIFEQQETQPSNKNRNSYKAPRSENDKMKELVNSFLEEMNSGSYDLIGEIQDYSSIKVVVTLDRSYTDKNSLSDIIDGQYKVLGKVTKVTQNDEGEVINLLRNTSFALLPASTFDELASNFASMGDIMPELFTEVKSPALQIVPICIFS